MTGWMLRSCMLAGLLLCACAKDDPAPSGPQADGDGDTDGDADSDTDSDSDTDTDTDTDCPGERCGTHKWACWPIPDVTTADYTDLGNGAVRDNITCLIWEKSNPEATGTWQDNFDRCAALATDNFAGYSDWRLPTRMEMASIAFVSLGGTGFADVFDVTGGYYLTGSFWYKTILTDNDNTAGNETDMVWGYGRNGFTSNAIVRSDEGNVARCVRGNGEGEAAGEYAVEPPDHYTIGDGTVTDNYTGLIWQQGFSFDLLDHGDAAAYCETLVLGGKDDWRVPRLQELASTVNEAKVGGAVVDEAFPDNPEGCREPRFWFFAAEASAVGGEGWGLSYCDGFTGWNAGDEGDWNWFPQANVRCVTGGF